MSAVSSPGAAGLSLGSGSRSYPGPEGLSAAGSGTPLLPRCHSGWTDRRWVNPAGSTRSPWRCPPADQSHSSPAGEHRQNLSVTYDHYNITTKTISMDLTQICTCMCWFKFLLIFSSTTTQRIKERRVKSYRTEWDYFLLHLSLPLLQQQAAVLLVKRTGVGQEARGQEDVPDQVFDLSLETGAAVGPTHLKHNKTSRDRRG